MPTIAAQLAEREARRAGRGIWTSGPYQVRYATPEALQGRTIRVRGYVRNSNGPSVWVDHPEQIEFIMAQAAPRQQASVKK